MELNHTYTVNNNIVFTSELETGTMANPYLFDLTGLNGISTQENVSDFRFGDIYPNPFDNTASLEFYIDKPGKVEGKVINALGQVIYTIIDKELESGTYELKINGETLTPGIYNLLLSYSNKQNKSLISKKMIIK